jgi:hypothetical protein
MSTAVPPAAKAQKSVPPPRTGIKKKAKAIPAARVQKSAPPASAGIKKKATPAARAQQITIPPGSSRTCTDLAGWYDADGPTYDCAWYAEGSNCADFGANYVYANFGLTANEACCGCSVPSTIVVAPPSCDLLSIFDTGDLEDKLGEAIDYFRSEIDTEALVENFRDADWHEAREAICELVSFSFASRALSCLAQAVDTTISLDFGADFNVLGVTSEFGLSLIWGEGGQFACAENVAIGATIGLLGAGASAGVSVSPAGLGGWDTVGASWQAPEICFSVGYSAVIGFAASVSIDTSRIDESNAIAAIENVMQIDLGSGVPPREYFLDLLLDLASGVYGITSVGFDATIGIDLLDVVVVGLILPDVSITACTQELTYCVGEGCEEKMMVEVWEDGSHCGLGTTCNNCDNEPTYWWGLAFTACGSEPNWPDGTTCGVGTTCNACLNPSSYWFGFPAFTKCGAEPRWSDGTPCLLGTSCNACQNEATWWVGDGTAACGHEPCWGSGTVSGLGTTDSMCCNGADCPWYQFGFCTCN